VGDGLKAVRCLDDRAWTSSRCLGRRCGPGPTSRSSQVVGEHNTCRASGPRGCESGDPWGGGSPDRAELSPLSCQHPLPGPRREGHPAVARLPVGAGATGFGGRMRSVLAGRCSRRGSWHPQPYLPLRCRPDVRCIPPMEDTVGRDQRSVVAPSRDRRAASESADRVVGGNRAPRFSPLRDDRPAPDGTGCAASRGQEPDL
jgi:hypothetical protein